MTTKIIRPPYGKLYHAVSVEPIPVNSRTAMAQTYCGKEITGVIGQAESVDDVTCARCEKAVRATVADELTRLGEEMDTYGEPTVIELSQPPVLSSPEVTKEPRRKYSPGRARHGRIQHERAMRRHWMKMGAESGLSTV